LVWDCYRPSRTRTWFLSGLALTALSVPLVVIGAQRVPVAPTVRVALVPSTLPSGAGLRLRVDW
jgi:hypothetical protein